MTASNATHQLTIATHGRGLRNTAAIMDKAEAHAKSHGIALETLLQSRLFPDMFTLLQQLQYVCYLSVDFARHFSATEAPRVGHDEATWGELRNSLDEAARYLDGIPRTRLNDASQRCCPPSWMAASARTRSPMPRRSSSQISTSTWPLPMLSCARTACRLASRTSSGH